MADFATGRLTNPTQAIAPLRLAARNNVNAAYSGMPQALANKTLAFGGPRSGKFGKAARMGETARLGGLAGVESDFARLALDEQYRGASLAEQLLGMNFGQESSGTSTETGSQSGTQVLPGNMLGGALGAGLGTFGGFLGMDAQSQMNGQQPINWGRIFGLGG